MKDLKELSNEELIGLLQTAHKTLKGAKLTITKLRKQARIVTTLKRALAEISFYYDRNDRVSDTECARLQGKVELKDELMELIKGE